jgi:hypothetical protein
VLVDLWVTLNPDLEDVPFPVTTLPLTCLACLPWVLTVKFLPNNSVNTLPVPLPEVTVDLPLDPLPPLDAPVNLDNPLSPLEFLNAPVKLSPTALPLLNVALPELPFLPTVSLAPLDKLVNKLVLKDTRLALKSKSLLPDSPLPCSPTLVLKSKSKCSEKRKLKLPSSLENAEN